MDEDYLAYDCAFCGEENEVLVDAGPGRRLTLTEDCHVCCRPNLLSIAVDGDGAVTLQVSQEDGG